MNRLVSFLLKAAIVLAPTPLFAAPITTLFGTGADAGSVDTHYTVLGIGAATVRTPLPPTYLPNNAASRWIWQNADGSPINTTLTFRTTFDLTGFDPTSASIAGLWGTDNQGFDILINGTSTGNQLLGVIQQNFNSLHAFAITSGFVSGINTLDFIIRDDGVVGAFRAQLSGTAVKVVSEPATLALLGLALMLVGFSRRPAR